MRVPNLSLEGEEERERGREIEVEGRERERFSLIASGAELHLRTRNNSHH